MTCIVGMVASDGRVLLGADSAGTEIGEDKDHQITEASAKVYRCGDLVAGVMGSSRVAQVVRHHVVPQVAEDLAAEERETGSRIGNSIGNIEGFVVHVFVPALRKALRTHGALERRGGEQVMNGSILLGLRGHLFWVCSDFAANEPTEGYYAIGTGRDAALGSLHTQAHTFAVIAPFADRSPTFVLTQALEAAAYYVPSVRGPFTFVSTPLDERELILGRGEWLIRGGPCHEA